MFDKLKLLRLARRLRKCPVTKLTRPALRSQKLVLPDGAIMRSLDYIDLVAKQFPTIEVNGKAIDYGSRMREIYYRNGLPGLNLYVSYMKLRVRVEMKKKKSPN